MDGHWPVVSSRFVLVRVISWIALSVKLPDTIHETTRSNTN